MYEKPAPIEVGYQGWAKRESRLRARLVDHIRHDPSLGRQIYKAAVKYAREELPNSVVNFVEFLPRGSYTLSQGDDIHTLRDLHLQNVDFEGEITLFVYCAEPGRPQHVCEVMYEVRFVRGKWIVEEIPYGQDTVDVSLIDSHLPFVLLPNGELVKIG